MALNRNPPPTSVRPAFEYSKNVGPIRMYLPELQGIIDYIGSHSDSRIMSAGSATGASSEDLHEVSNDQMRHVALQTVAPSVIVWLWERRCKVVTYENSPSATKLADDIAALLQEHRGGRLSAVTSRAGWPIYVMGLTSFLLFVTSLYSEANALTTIVGIFTGIVATSLIGVSVWESRTQGVTRILAFTRQEARERGHSASLVVWSTVGGSAVTGVATFLVTVATLH